MNQDVYIRVGDVDAAITPLLMQAFKDGQIKLRASYGNYVGRNLFMKRSQTAWALKPEKVDNELNPAYADTIFRDGLSDGVEITILKADYKAFATTLGFKSVEAKGEANSNAGNDERIKAIEERKALLKGFWTDNEFHNLKTGEAVKRLKESKVYSTMQKNRPKDSTLKKYHRDWCKEWNNEI